MILKYNNRVITHNDRWINNNNDPYNPLNLPPYTIRLLYKDGDTPTFTKGTAVQISQEPNVWDLTYSNSDWSAILKGHESLLEVLGANTTGVVNMGGMFRGCYYLTSVEIFDTSTVLYMGRMFQASTSLSTVPLFDTSNVVDMFWMFTNCTNLVSVPLFNTSNVVDMVNMFNNCQSLTSIPLFDTSKLLDMDSMFYHCYDVQTGALALYQQASAQSIPPRSHEDTFYNCGIDTTTGLAELNQIPQSWGGLA